MSHPNASSSLRVQHFKVYRKSINRFQQETEDNRFHGRLMLTTVGERQKKNKNNHAKTVSKQSGKKSDKQKMQM